MTRRKRTVRLVLLIALLLLVALAVAGNFLYAFSLKTRRSERAPGVPEHVAGTSEDTASVRLSGDWFGTHAQDVYLTSGDGLRLRGHYAKQQGNRYVIAMHGYSGNGHTMSGFGEAFFQRGFSVLMPDCRGHGESEGDYIGMGWHDRLDLLQWIDWVIASDAQAEILLFGISMGGATVMMASGEALPEQVKAIVEDCGYTSVWDEFSVQLREQFGLPAFPFLHAASVVTKLRAGYWLGEADARAQVARSTVPMLFIHGDADTFVPYWMLEPLYDAKTTGLKEKLIVPGAAHGMASSTDPQAYWGAIDAFVEATF